MNRLLPIALKYTEGAGEGARVSYEGGVVWECRMSGLGMFALVSGQPTWGGG